MPRVPRRSKVIRVDCRKGLSKNRNFQLQVSQVKRLWSRKSKEQLWRWEPASQVLKEEMGSLAFRIAQVALHCRKMHRQLGWEGIKPVIMDLRRRVPLPEVLRRSISVVFIIQGTMSLGKREGPGLLSLCHCVQSWGSEDGSLSNPSVP